MGKTIAIDFGTTNTVVAEWVEASRSPETVVLDGLSYRLQAGPPAVPSLVFVDDVKTNAYRVGYSVISQGLFEHPEASTRLLTSMKRDLLGDRPTTEGPSHRRLLTSERGAEIFLDSVVRAFLATGRSITDLVLTTPVVAFESYLRWLSRAVRGLSSLRDVPVRIIDEPTAAAFGYGIDAAGGHVLVIDFGGGTLDLSIVRLPEDLALPAPGVVLGTGADPDLAAATQRDRIKARVIAKEPCALGGDAIDETLVDLLLQKAGTSRGAAMDDLPGLRRIAEDAKKALSTETEFEAIYYLRSQKKSLHYTVTRHEFEQEVLNAPALDALTTLKRKIEKVLKEAEEQNVGENQLDAVLLVGGTTMIPAIRNLVEERFGKDRVMQRRPFEAVAHGALRLTQSCRLDDVLHHSYAIEVKVPPKAVKQQPAQEMGTEDRSSAQRSRPSFLWSLFGGRPSPSSTQPTKIQASPPAQSEVPERQSQPAPYEYVIILRTGTVYPLDDHQALPFYLQPMEDGVSHLDFVIAEIEEGDAPGPREVLDSRGQRLLERGRNTLDRAQIVKLLSDKCIVTLNPLGKRSETDRLDVSFTVDENRRLLLTVFDRVAHQHLLYNAPVVRLE